MNLTEAAGLIVTLIVVLFFSFSVPYPGATCKCQPNITSVCLAKREVYCASFVVNAPSSLLSHLFCVMALKHKTYFAFAFFLYIIYGLQNVKKRM